MGAIFAKTAKGHAEITTKAGGLTPRIRRVLIFIDGKRTVEDLRSMLTADDLQITLGRLEEEGYIELIHGAAIASAPPPAAAAASITAFRPLPPAPDPTHLQQARNFMTNTLNAFIGTMGASSLLQRMSICANCSTSGSTPWSIHAKAAAKPRPCAANCCKSSELFRKPWLPL